MSVLARAAALCSSGWAALLAERPCATGLGARQLAALLQALTALGNRDSASGGASSSAGSAHGGGGGADALARALLQADGDALVRAVRLGSAGNGSGGGGGDGDGVGGGDGGGGGSEDGEDEDPVAAQAARRALARALLAAAPPPLLGGLPAGEFQGAVRRLELAERAGEAGADLETCLAEEYFGGSGA